jgi:HlyD family secretion protein
MTRKDRGAILRLGAMRLAVLTGLALLTIAASASGYQWWRARAGRSAPTTAILHRVTRLPFVYEIVARGEIKSAGTTEIRSLVKTKNTPGVAILRIIPEGSEVKQGDFLVELDWSAMDAERTSQQVLVNTTEALVVEARNLYETAILSKQEYLEGTYVEGRQTIEGEIFVAEENLNRAKEYYLYSQKLASKGYVNQLQLEADQFAVEKSAKELQAARTKLEVLDQFTKAKTLKQLESDIVISKAKWEAAENSYKLEEQTLREIEEQIANCTIIAPRDGTVIYAHQRDHRGNADFIVEEGALVRERQEIINLPDPESMRVELSINESKVQYVQPGMEAKIVPVGLDDIVLKGTVDMVNQYAEPSGWRKANVKEYKAYVDINVPPDELRAGMTCSVTIRCAELASVMQVPVQSIYAHGKQFYCFVYHEGKWRAQPVACGLANDNFFVIEQGLEEEEQVAMNPRRYLDQVDLPELAPEKKQRAVPQ